MTIDHPINNEDEEEMNLPVLIITKVTGNHENYMNVLGKHINIDPKLVTDRDMDNNLKKKYSSNVWNYVKHSFSAGKIGKKGEILGYKGPLVEKYVTSIPLHEVIDIKGERKALVMLGTLKESTMKHKKRERNHLKFL